MSINDVKAYVDLSRRGVSTASERLHIIEYYAHVARQQLLDVQRRILILWTEKLRTTKI